MPLMTHGKGHYQCSLLQSFKSLLCFSPSHNKVIKDQDTEDGDHGLIDRVLEAGAVSEVARAYEIIRKSEDDYQDELLSTKKLLSELLQH